MKLDLHLTPYTKIFLKLKRPEAKTPRKHGCVGGYVTVVIAMTSCHEAQGTEASTDS